MAVVASVGPLGLRPNCVESAVSYGRGEKVPVVLSLSGGGFGSSGSGQKAVHAADQPRGAHAPLGLGISAAIAAKQGGQRPVSPKVSSSKANVCRASALGALKWRGCSPSEVEFLD